jgi:hypothetical protein
MRDGANGSAGRSGSIRPGNTFAATCERCHILRADEQLRGGGHRVVVESGVSAPHKRASEWLPNPEPDAIAIFSPCRIVPSVKPGLDSVGVRDRKIFADMCIDRAHDRILAEIRKHVATSDNLSHRMHAPIGPPGKDGGYRLSSEESERELQLTLNRTLT